MISEVPTLYIVLTGDGDNKYVYLQQKLIL